MIKDELITIYVYRVTTVETVREKPRGCQSVNFMVVGGLVCSQRWCSLPNDNGIMSVIYNWEQYVEFI